MNNASLRVLAVDDELAIRRYLGTVLDAAGYATSLVPDGNSALNECVRFRPDLIILDLGLPDMDGLEVLRQMREYVAVPIVILSAREDERTKVQALDLGADDYLTKPFGARELLARLRVVMRRPSQLASEPVFVTDDLRVDLPRRLVTVAGKEVRLTPTEYDLLRALVAYPDRVLTHNHLIRNLWGDEHPEALHLLRVNVSSLRRKLEIDPVRPRHIITEPGVGYRLASGFPEEVQEPAIAGQ